MVMKALLTLSLLLMVALSYGRLYRDEFVIAHIRTPRLRHQCTTDVISDFRFIILVNRSIVCLDITLEYLVSYFVLSIECASRNITKSNYSKICRLIPTKISHISKAPNITSLMHYPLTNFPTILKFQFASTQL